MADEITDFVIVKDYGFLAGKQYLPREIAAICYDNGFRLRRLVMAVQIALAESEGWDRAQHVYENAEGQVIYADRGMWQFHSKWHAEVTDECAFDPYCAVKHLYRVSDGGRSWGQWSSFASGAYKYQRQKAIKGVINFYWLRFHKRIPFFDNLT